MTDDPERGLHALRGNTWEDEEERLASIRGDGYRQRRWGWAIAAAVGVLAIVAAVLL